MAGVSADVLVAPAGVGADSGVAGGGGAAVAYFNIIKPLLVDSSSETIPVSVECRLLIDLILTWALLLGRFFGSPCNRHCWHRSSDCRYRSTGCSGSVCSASESR